MMNKIMYDERFDKYDYNTDAVGMLCSKDEIKEILKGEEVTCCYSDGSLLHKTTNVGFACTLITGYKGSYITW